FLGKNKLGKDFSFDIRIKAGAGTFVCGELMALIDTLEGKCGMSRLKLPIPVVKDYQGMPTIKNNVEIYVNLVLKIRICGNKIKEIIYDVGGGISNGKKLKAVQMGGPSGGCIPTELIDTTVDYESLQKTGAIMGSGGMVVMDEATCMVNMAKFFLEFTKKES